MLPWVQVGRLQPSSSRPPGVDVQAMGEHRMRQHATTAAQLRPKMVRPSHRPCALPLFFAVAAVGRAPAAAARGIVHGHRRNPVSWTTTI
eukprot:SAG31_NODE_37070_length_307_cov_1.264423_1_plen_89_part_01